MGFTTWDLGACNCAAPTITVNVTSLCNNAPLQGQTVTLADPNSGAVLASGTTDASGNWSTQALSTGTHYKVSATPTSPRFAPYSDSTIYSAQTQTIGAALSPASGYVCVASCSIPTTSTLHLSITLDGTAYNETATYGTGQWLFSWTDPNTGIGYSAAFGNGQLAVSKNQNSLVSNCPAVTGTVVCPPSFQATFSPSGCPFWTGTATITE